MTAKRSTITDALHRPGAGRAGERPGRGSRSDDHGRSRGHFAADRMAGALRAPTALGRAGPRRGAIVASVVAAGVGSG